MRLLGWLSKDPAKFFKTATNKIQPMFLTQHIVVKHMDTLHCATWQLGNTLKHLLPGLLGCGAPRTQCVCVLKVGSAHPVSTGREYCNLGIVPT
jgi:hypothetical protein